MGAERRLDGHAAHGHAGSPARGPARSRRSPRGPADADLEPVDAGRRRAAADAPVPRHGLRDRPEPDDCDLPRPRESVRKIASSDGRFVEPENVTVTGFGYRP